MARVGENLLGRNYKHRAQIKTYAGVKIQMGKVSVICTVKNEEASIRGFLDSLLAQTKKPDEVMIVDGGSTDKTADIIKEFHNKGHPIKLIIDEKANISQGRNVAITNSKYDVIASTDAGCKADKRWLEHITAPFQDPDIDVVGGFYMPDSKTPFEECVAAFTHMRLKDIDPATFVPSARSVAFRKRAWEAVGGYPEYLYTAEDTLFGLSLKKAGFRFQFQPKAIVYWRPRTTWKAFFKQMYLYSKGDAQAKVNGTIYFNVLVRYGIGIALLILGFFHWLSWVVLLFGVAVYFLRRILPRAKRINTKVLMWLVALRITCDAAQAIGYLQGKLDKPNRGEKH